LLAALTVAARADTAAVTIAVPFSYVHHEVVVRATIGHAGPYAFLVDTDTTPSAIDSSLARKLRLPVLGDAGAGSGVGSGRSVVLPVAIPNLAIGDLHVARLNALATDLSALSTAFGMPIAGVLGTSLLNDRVVQIDYPCRTVAFLPDAILAPFTARFRYGPDAAESGDNVSDDVWIGSRRATATFDTGNAGFMLVTGKGIVDLRLDAAARSGAASAARGYNGVASATQGTVHGVRIGSIRIGSVATKFIASSQDPFDVNIGNRTFERFVATFDYQRGLLTLQPPRPCNGPSSSQ
jgi:predicted aspartyl protease